MSCKNLTMSQKEENVGKKKRGGENVNNSSLGLGKSKGKKFETLAEL